MTNPIDESIMHVENAASCLNSKLLGVAAQQMRDMRDTLQSIVSASNESERMGYSPLNSVYLKAAHAALEGKAHDYPKTEAPQGWLCLRCGENDVPPTHVTYAETHDGCGGPCVFGPLAGKYIPAAEVAALAREINAAIDEIEHFDINGRNLTKSRVHEMTATLLALAEGKQG